MADGKGRGAEAERRAEPGGSPEAAPAAAEPRSAPGEETERLQVISHAGAGSQRQEELCSLKRTSDTSNQAGNLEEKSNQVPPEYQFHRR